MIRSAPALLILGVILCGCGKSRAEAEAAVAKFRVRLGSGQYAEIYRDATPEFREKITEPEFAKMMEGVAKKLGRFRSASLQSWNLNFGTGGRTITLGFASVYEKGKAQETFGWKGSGDGMALQGYNINSSALVTY
jgi:hypothetical protein